VIGNVELGGQVTLTDGSPITTKFGTFIDIKDSTGKHIGFISSDGLRGAGRAHRMASRAKTPAIWRRCG